MTTDLSQPTERTSLLAHTSEHLHSSTAWFHCIRHSTIWKHQFVTLLPSLLLGIIIWFGVNPTDDLTPTAIHILAVFASCIAALITTSVETSLLALTGLTVLSLTHSFQCRDSVTGESTECRLCGEFNPVTGEPYHCYSGRDSFHHSLEGFSSSVVWLIFAAFHLGKAVEVTQLGRRVSLLMIKWFGQSLLGLAYAIVLSELFLGLFVPSNTARGGGIVLPVVNSIVNTLGSTPNHNAPIGSFLLQVGNHANYISASMYLTGMAANPLVFTRASQLFPSLKLNFLTWLTGNIMPGLVCAAALPPILYRLCNVESTLIKDEEFGQHRRTSSTGTASYANRSANEAIVGFARAELNRMGPMSLKEWQLCLVLVMCLSLWVTSSYTGLDSALVALLGILALLHLETISWKDVSHNTNAWDTLFWLGSFVTMAHQLSDAGASAFLGGSISSLIERANLPVLPSLTIAYLATSFLFSSLSAHIVAFVGTFLDAGRVLGAKPMIITVLLAYFSALGASMTNYSTGTSAMYFAPGYLSRARWFLIGVELVAFYLLVYFTIGLGWWRLLGWW